MRLDREIGRVARPAPYRSDLAKEAEECIRRREGRPDLHGRTRDVGARLERPERTRHRAGIRPDEPSPPELHTTEIAGDNGSDLADPGVREHIKDRTPRGSVRFARITQPDAGRIAGRTRIVCPAVMGRGRELGADPVDEGAGLAQVPHPAERGHEPALPDRLLTPVEGRDRNRVAARLGGTSTLPDLSHLPPARARPPPGRHARRQSRRADARARPRPRARGSRGRGHRACP